MNENELIKTFQKDCFNAYKGSINYPATLTYLYGNPINVQVPIETVQGKYMIVGAYPSAKFYTVRGIRDVPLLDNDSPFSNESYYDGSRVRTIPSGRELNETILNQIGVRREDCWITDLVKVFLFKQGHIDKYLKLNKLDIKENRSKLATYSRDSIPWLVREIKLAEPKLVILLGLEVISALFEVSEKTAKEKMDGAIHGLELDGLSIKTICLPHPGILMKPSAINPWPNQFRDEIAPNVIKEIQKL
jgi:hypothetical protein